MSITEIRNGISYTVPNDRRGYQPPPAQQEWRAPDVTAPAVKAEGSVVQQAHKAVVHAHNEFRKHLDATEAIRGNFTEDGYRAQVAVFQNTSAAKAVDAALESVVARRDAAAEHVAKVKRDLSPPADTAGELRSTRYRDRIIRQLDTKESGALFEAANELIAGATRQELSVLLEELPTYLQSRGATSDWIDARVGQVVPEYGAARQQLQRAESARQIVDYNVKSVRKGFADGRASSVFADPTRFDPDA